MHRDKGLNFVIQFGLKTKEAANENSKTGVCNKRLMSRIKGGDNKMGEEGAMNLYINFGTDVFSIRKNVRKWIESQMERFIRTFCFEVKSYKYSTKEIS